SAATPSSTSCLSHAVRSWRTISSLKRLQTMAIRSPSPFRSGVCAFIRLDRLHDRIVRRDVLDHFEAESGHARDALRASQHAHLPDAQILQDLRADAVKTRVPALAKPLVAAARFEATEDFHGLRRRLVPAKQDHDALLVVRDDAKRVLHRVGVSIGVEVEK